ncbi:hypothetical protein [Micromonospora sp. NPDC005173]|uniref:hypothetical protein n=1 Tax=Micromonospora sp. NPDC005173 TaxID=3157165 RepID=UPI0033ADA545
MNDIVLGPGTSEGSDGAGGEAIAPSGPGSGTCPTPAPATNALEADAAIEALGATVADVIDPEPTR